MDTPELPDPSKMLCSVWYPALLVGVHVGNGLGWSPDGGVVQAEIR